MVQKIQDWHTFNKVLNHHSDHQNPIFLQDTLVYDGVLTLVAVVVNYISDCFLTCMQLQGITLKCWTCIHINNSSVCITQLYSVNSFGNHHSKWTFVSPPKALILFKESLECFSSSTSFHAYACTYTFFFFFTSKATVMINNVCSVSRVKTVM